MKQLSTIITLLLALNFSFGQMNDLIISEYAEGTSNNKYIEIFNGTGLDVDLSEYQLRRISNGGPTSGSVVLSGILSNGNTYVIANPSSSSLILANTDLQSNIINMTGDDSISLRKDDGTGTFIEIDIIGVLGVDPGNGWDVAGITEATSEHTLIRKSNVCTTNTNWSSSAGTNADNSEWIVLAQDDWSDIGNHTTNCCIYYSTWAAGVWFPNTPTINTTVTITDSYDTAIDGSFSACSITVSTGNLNIADGDYVEVQNDIIVDAGASIVVQPYGAFIQNNDTGVVTNNGIMQVDKLTAPIDNWYEYTYWSSPVTNATVGTALGDADSDRIFTYNGALYNDELAETNNNNTFVAGQDGIDDEGDDWQWVSGINLMIPGVGYAATHSELAMLPFPAVNYRYSFIGTFNNGLVTVPVDRNDNTNLDDNWNFIGNPYPSAISVNEFMAQNLYPAGPLDGAVYFWSQNTDYNSTENGNSGLNFSISDYAVENGSGGTTGGDGITTTGFIPSGQGFFVSFSDSAPSNSGTVIFNNGMRRLNLSPDNSVFFKNGNAKKKAVSEDNKFWINLTSDNGVFNQILVAYVNGATNNDDGAFYDAKKIIAPTTYAALYSQIENSNKTFVIQGKAPNSLNENEQIALGFKTTIDVATLYTLSLAKLQGDFLTNNPVYLKDNLLGKTHNLSESDYTFTSETGTFNERFQIVFSNAALHTNTAIANNNNSLKITALQDDFVQFSTNNNVTIKTVKIYDVLGRTLYSFSGNSSTETYNVSKLKSSVFVAKVMLSNGVEISRKAVKR